MKYAKLFRVRIWYVLMIVILLCSNGVQFPLQHVSASAADSNANSVNWMNEISDWQLDEAAGLLYVVSSASDNLYLIDIQQMKILKTLTVGAKPNAMSRYGNILYIALSGEGKIARVDLSTQSQLAPISTTGNPYYVAATSTHLFYSTDGATYKYQFSDQTNAYMYIQSRSSLYADESTNSLYIGNPFWSGSDFMKLNYLTNEIISESRSFDGNHLNYPNEKIFVDQNFVYYAGSKIDKNNLKSVYGTYPVSKGSAYYYAQISDVNDRFLLTHEAIFEKDTLKKVADLPYQTTRALISNDGDTIYLFNKDEDVIEKYDLVETAPNKLTLLASGSQFLQANYEITDMATNEATPYLFIISEETNDLVVLDKTTNRVVNTLTIGSKPSDIELLNDKIYIALSGESNIGKISVSDALSPSGVLARIPTKDYPYRIAPDASRVFYTADDQHQSLRVLTEASVTEQTYLSLYYPSLFGDQVSQTLYAADSHGTGSRIYSYSIANNALSLKAASPLHDFKYVEQRYVHADGDYVYYDHDRLKASDLTVLSTYPEQIIYAKNQWVFSMNAVYERETSTEIAKLPFAALHIYVSEGEAVYISSEKRLYYFENMDALIAYSRNANTIGVPLLLDQHEEAGKIQGCIVFSRAEDDGAIASYNIYFADAQGNKVEFIGNANEQYKVNDNFYEYKIFNEIAVPSGAVRIGVAAVIKGSLSDSGSLVLGQLWDSPTYMAQEIRLTDTDNRSDHFAGTISWNKTSIEPVNGNYQIYFTDGEELLGEPIRTVPGGAADYTVTLGDTIVPSEAIGIAVILEDSVGNAGPLFYPIAFSEKMSAPISPSDVTIVNNETGADRITVTGVSFGDQIWVRKYGSNLLLFANTTMTSQNSFSLDIPGIGNPSDKLLLIRRSIGKYFSAPLVVTVPNISTPGGGTPGGGTPGGGTPGGGTPGGSTPGGGTPGGGTPGGGTPGGSTPGGGALGGDIHEESSDLPWDTNTSIMPNGKLSVQIQLKDNALEELIKNDDEFNNSMVYRITSSDPADRYEVTMPIKFLSGMLSHEISSILRISTPKGSWQLPVSALLKGLSTTASDSVIISIEHASTEYEVNLKEQLAGSGIQPFGSLVDFSITVNKQPFNQFSEYAEHELIIETERISLNQLAGMTYDPVTKKFVPVPIKAEWKDGILRVSLFKKGNSVYTVVMTGKTTYKDVAVNSKYRESIEALTNRLVLEGFADGTFKPEKSITRVEFAAILNRSLGILPNSNNITSQFKDIKKGAWYEKDIHAAVSAGLITGYSASSFKPDQTITHQEMIVMLVRAYGYVHTDSSTAAGDAAPAALKLTQWFIPTYQKAVQEGILLSDKDSFKFQPTQSATRQDSAYLLQRLLKLLEFS